MKCPDCSRELSLIDLDKFIESLMWMWDSYKDNPLFKNPIFDDIKLALDKQGLKYKDGKIVKTQRRISAETKENDYDEDEKIRKRIILCLEECVHSDIIRDYEKDECIAWLEQQKKK